MGYRDDCVMRTINDSVRATTGLVLGRNDIGYDLPEDGDRYTDLNRVYKRLKDLVDKGNTNDTENLLTDEPDTGNLGCLEMVLAFYMYLNQPKGDKLYTASYSREEIVDRTNNVCTGYGILGFEHFVDTTMA